MSTRQAFGLPLLAKELIEQSARKRTYVIRSIYAILFFGFALMIFWGSIYDSINTPYELLGKGREMFTILMVLQIFGVALFTPALTCGTISSEKERNTIGLLFLTKLGPFSILLEKYLGRLFVMGTYLIISLPLFGFCYTLGGLEQKQVWFGFYGLILLVCELAALGLFCSTYFRTTVGSFIATYLIGIAILIGPIFLYELLPRSIGRELATPIWASVKIFMFYLGFLGDVALSGVAQLLNIDLSKIYFWEPVWQDISYSNEMQNGFVFFPPPMLMEAAEGSPNKVPNWQMFALGIPTMGLTLFFLVLSRLFLVRRAFASPKRYLMMFFQLLDKAFHRANQNRFTKGIVLIKEHSSLPRYHPIAWRETSKTALGSIQYLIRIFVAIEFPVLLICLIAVGNSNSGYYQYHRSGAVIGVNFICWIIAILLTVVRSASLVAGERSHETLDVLLTTPISSIQFVLQKFRGVNRLILVLSLPLLTGMIMQAWYGGISEGWFNGNIIRDPDESPICYLITMVLNLVIMLQLFAWVSMLMGMWMKTSTRAIFASLALVVGWMILPIVVLVTFFEMFHVGRHSVIVMSLIASPAMVPFLTEIGEMDDLFDQDMVWPVVITHIMIYTSLLFAIRWFCLKRAAKLLGRSEDDWN